MIDIEKLSDAQQRVVRFMAENNTTVDIETGVRHGASFGLAGHDWDQLYGRAPSTATIFALVDRGWLKVAEKQSAPWRQREYTFTDEAIEALSLNEDPKLLWELINPSDSYTFVGTYRVAAAVVLVLSKGQYGAEEVGGEHEIPLMMFGGAEDWVDAEFGEKSLESFFKNTDNMEIAECLESFVIGNETDRENYFRGLGERDEKEAAEYWMEWHDARRSSLNDIGQEAMRLAIALRASEEEEEAEKNNGQG